MSIRTSTSVYDDSSPIDAYTHGHVPWGVPSSSSTALDSVLDLSAFPAPPSHIPRGSPPAVYAAAAGLGGSVGLERVASIASVMSGNGSGIGGVAGWREREKRTSAGGQGQGDRSSVLSVTSSTSHGHGYRLQNQNPPPTNPPSTPLQIGRAHV